MVLDSSFEWIKLGQLYEPKSLSEKLQSHAANPIAVHLQNDIFRIYFSGRNSQNRSSVGFVDIDILKHIVHRVQPEPIFSYGNDDSFFSHGVSIGCIQEIKEQTLIFFMGWQCASDQHWRGDIGVLVLDNKETLSLLSSKPYLPTDDIDPISFSYPWITKKPNGELIMYYGSTRTWNSPNGEMVHVINKAFSRDGIYWEKHGLAVPYFEGVAQAFSRPTVLIDKYGKYHMWFSYRSGTGTPYRIGYASSSDGISWQLELHKSGIEVSPSGWDSEMIEYPFVFTHKSNVYMLYNGNGYGKTGFGLCLLRSDKAMV